MKGEEAPPERQKDTAAIATVQIVSLEQEIHPIRYTLWNMTCLSHVEGQAAYVKAWSVNTNVSDLLVHVIWLGWLCFMGCQPFVLQVPRSDHGHNVSNDSRHPVSIGVSFNAEEACLHADHRPRIMKPAAMTRSSLHAAEPASQRQTKVPCKQGGAGRKPATAKTGPAVVIERHPQS